MTTETLERISRLAPKIDPQYRPILDLAVELGADIDYDLHAGVLWLYGAPYVNGEGENDLPGIGVCTPADHKGLAGEESWLIGRYPSTHSMTPGDTWTSELELTAVLAIRFAWNLNAEEVTA